MHRNFKSRVKECIADMKKRIQIIIIIMIIIILFLLLPGLLDPVQSLVGYKWKKGMK